MPTSEAFPKTPVFPKDEFASRLGRVQAELDRRGVDLLVLFAPEHVFYLSGYQTFAGRTFAALLVPRRGVPVLLVRRLEVYLAALYGEVADVVTYDDHEDPIARLGTEASGRLSGEARLALEDAPGMTAAARGRLASHLGGRDVQDGSGLIERLRRIKSPREIEKMREAARLTVLGMRAALEACRPGASENDVAAAAMGAMVRAGSEYFPLDPVVASGYRAGIPHATFERRILRAGDTVLLEMSGVCGRYVAPLMRTASLGEPSAAVRRMAELCLEQLTRTIAAVRPGATAGDVDQACASVLEEALPSDPLRKRAGYSVGFAFPPGWNESHVISLKRDDPTVLEPGMALYVVPAHWEYGVSGVGLGETLLVNPAGCEALAGVPSALTVVT